MNHQDNDATVPATPARNSYVRVFAVAGLTVLLLVAIAGSALALNAHVQSSYKQKDDAYRALAIRTDTNKQQAQKAHEDALKAAVTTATAATKRHDVRVLRRAVRKMKSAARRKIDAAYKQGQSDGYSSGSAAGYSAGSDAGFSQGTEAGLIKGSDDLTCSDDPDVSWLPFC
jgi:hypothetical protein